MFPDCCNSGLHKSFLYFAMGFQVFFSMTSKLATKHRSRQESAQSGTVHVVHYLHWSLWKLTGKSRFICFFLEQHVVQEDEHDVSTWNGCSETLSKLTACFQGTDLVPIISFLLQPKNCSAFMGGSAQLLASFILWNGDICGFETPSGLRWWLRVSTVSEIWMWNEIGVHFLSSFEDPCLSS